MELQAWFGRQAMRQRAFDYPTERPNVSETGEFAIKPQLAQHMIERVIAAQVQFPWFTGDTIYGNDRRLRVWLEQWDVHFVLAVASNPHVWSVSATTDDAGRKNNLRL